MNESDNDVGQTRLGAKLRRGHKKVKTGCVDCRRRRVKCTEERPKCRACQRRGAECEYPFPEARSVSADPSPAQQSHATSPHQHVSPLPGLSSTTISSILKDYTNKSTYGIRDMALLHQWTVSTCHHIYKNSALSLTFQLEFPRIAFKHPFVMQALLGLTALHIAYLEPEQRLSHAAEASRYHNLSLQGFNEALKHASDEMANELFAWSSLNLFYVFGVSGRLGQGLWGESEWGSRKDRILGLGWIPMLRGVQTILSPSLCTLKAGPLRDLVSIQNWDGLDVEKANHIEDQYFCQTRDVWKDLPDAQTYEDTLQVLRRCRMYSAQFSGLQAESPDGEIFNRSWQGAFLLVPFAPESYFTLLRQRQPPALILYAFYGALLHRFNNDSWFMEGWGYDIVEVVSDLLGSYWREWIAWPIEVVDLNNK